MHCIGFLYDIVDLNTLLQEIYRALLLSGFPGKGGGKGRSVGAESEVEGGGGFGGEQEGEFGGGGGGLEEETWRAAGCCGAAPAGKTQ